MPPFPPAREIIYFYLTLFPTAIALGDGNEDDGNHGNDEPDGRDPAAHAVEIKKVEQGAERLPSRDYRETRSR